MKSRYNALKHGIFANVVLRGSALREKKADYEKLLQSFRESIQPEGGLEEFLVEKLAQIAWRKARAVKAEAAIIMKQTEFLREDRDCQLKEASQGSGFQLARFTGIARKCENPYLLHKSLQFLEVLRDGIEARGFERETDERLLQVLYGEVNSPEGLFLNYRVLSDRAKNSPEPRSVAEECVKRFLEALDMEIAEIKGKTGDLEAREEVELPLMEESLAVPQEKELDRLLRYEARLDGAFDRTLQQLERLQRMRLGQPVPPTLKVDITR